MTKNEFGLQIERLSSTFGNRYYEGERLELLWLQFGYLANHIFSKVVTDLILTEKNPPLAREIKEKIPIFKEDNFSNKQSSYTEQCKECNSTGIIWAQDKEQRRYVFKCNCKNDGGLNKAIPIWGYSFQSQYTKI
jgi:hypothetical protein